MRYGLLVLLLFVAPVVGFYFRGSSTLDRFGGVTYAIHTSDTRGIQTFTPPTTGRGQDWMLVIRDTSTEP
ncbi:MAG: putative collagen-binding domain-containing protein [Rhodothermales bacterium]|nr:putative collagen-binding domain-containing protein [Rhodothermales bacterium]